MIYLWNLRQIYLFIFFASLRIEEMELRDNFNLHISERYSCMLNSGDQ
jgi:hypothetical protein